MLFFFFSWITIVVSTASHEARIHQPTRIRKLTASWNAAQHRFTHRHQPLAKPPLCRAHSILTNTHAIECKSLPKTPSAAAKKPQVQTRKYRINRNNQSMIPLQTCKARQASGRSCHCVISHQRIDRFRKALRADQLNRRTSPVVENCHLHRFLLSHHQPWHRPGTTRNGSRFDKIPTP